MNTIGIDFGTTNSAVAVYLEKENKVISSGYEGTLLYFEQSNDQVYHIGQQAIEKYLEHGMRGRFMRSLKSILHLKSFQYTYVYGKKYFAEDLVALILKHLRTVASDLSGSNCERVVLGRPARFSPDPMADRIAQERLKKAARIAGFKEITFQLEPIAAAFTYENEIQKEELVFVGDLGGGTADFTLMRVGPGRDRNADRSQDILGTTGVRVGGDDLDAIIAWKKVVRHLGLGLTYDADQRGKILPIPSHHYAKFCRWENHFQLNTSGTMRELENYLWWTKDNPQIANFITLISNNLGYALFNSIENAKKDLSAKDIAQISFDKMGVKIEEAIALGEFGEMVEPQTDKLLKCMDDLLGKTGVKEGDVDSVFLTGGTSLVRPVRDLFARKFGEEKIKESDSFNSVAKGLALSAH